MPVPLVVPVAEEPVCEEDELVETVLTPVEEPVEEPVAEAA